MKTIIIQKNDSGQRLDKFLTKYMPSLPKGMLYKGLRKKCVRVNGTHIKDGAHFLHEGDELSLYFKDEFFPKETTSDSFLPIPFDLDILYEDENILLVNKKPGVVVHADDKGSGDTLIAQIQSYLYQKGEYSPVKEYTFSPALANRIDRNTGGIVIAAKNAQSLRILNEAIRHREIKKEYLCIVKGYLDEKQGILSGHLLREENQRQVSVSASPVPGAKSIQTKYRVLSEKNEMSLVEVELLTGRTHQIRAHLASIGHPLAGDQKYGDAEWNRTLPFRHQALYSYQLTFMFSGAHPLSYLNGKRFTVQQVPFISLFE